MGYNSGVIYSVGLRVTRRTLNAIQNGRRVQT